MPNNFHFHSMPIRSLKTLISPLVGGKTIFSPKPYQIYTFSKTRFNLDHIFLLHRVHLRPENSVWSPSSLSSAGPTPHLIYKAETSSFLLHFIPTTCNQLKLPSSFFFFFFLSLRSRENSSKLKIHHHHCILLVEGSLSTSILRHSAAGWHPNSQYQCCWASLESSSRVRDIGRWIC